MSELPKVLCNSCCLQKGLLRFRYILEKPEYEAICPDCKKTFKVNPKMPTIEVKSESK